MIADRPSGLRQSTISFSIAAGEYADKAGRQRFDPEAGGEVRALGTRKEVNHVRLTWKSTLALAAVIGLIAFLGAIVAQKAWAQAKGPADFEYDGKGSGKVVFSHEKHAAKNPKCTDCHTKVFKMAKGVRTAFKMVINSP